MQIYLQQQLGVPTPAYRHLPIATNAAGEKLSKQTKAPAINPAGDPVVLFQALRFLGEHPAMAGSCRELLSEAIRAKHRIHPGVLPG